MGRIFDDPREQARREWEESGCPYCGYDERTCGCYEDLYPEDDHEEEEPEALSLCESFHYLLYSDPKDRDPDWEEIHRKVLAGARPADE